MRPPPRATDFEIIVDDSVPQTCLTVPVLDLDTCAPTIEYDGYVQACCELISSTAGRVYWTASFVSDPACVSKVTCCQSIRALNSAWFVMTNVGSGYTPSSTVPVTIVRDPADTAAGDATVVANTNPSGEVVNFTVSVGGYYNKIPLVVIDAPGSGTQATAILSIPCTDNEIGTTNGYKDDCTNSGVGTIVNLQLGQCADYCYPKEHPFIYDNSLLTGSPDTLHFNYVNSGCCDCTACQNYTVVVSSSKATVNICYTQCTQPGPPLVPSIEICASHPGSGSISLECVVPGSIYCSNDANAIVGIFNSGGLPLCCAGPIG